MIVMPFVMVTGFQNSNDEYTIKALFVYNFTKYIEWNQQNMQPQFKIGVMGESGIREKLATILKGKKLYNRTTRDCILHGLSRGTIINAIYHIKYQSSSAARYRSNLFDRFDTYGSKYVCIDKSK